MSAQEVQQKKELEDQILKLEELGPILKQLNDVEKQVTAIQIDKRLSNKR